MSRWVLLEHIVSAEDPASSHFDLLLEDGLSCRSWQLSEVPVVDGYSIPVLPRPKHNLDWLEIKEKLVSGNRGKAKRIMKGTFVGCCPRIHSERLRILLLGSELEGYLEIYKDLLKIRSNPKN